MISRVLPSAATESFVADDWRGPQVAGERRKRPRKSSPHNPRALSKREHLRATAIIDRAKDALREEFRRVRMGDALNTGMLTDTAREISRSMRRNKFAIVGLTRIRDRHEYTYVHSIAVSALMIGLARELGFHDSEVEALGVAGLLHDIGKARVPIAVLDKPGPLTPDEWSTVMTHPQRGHTILARFEHVDPIVLDVCLHHHERIDGTGYPMQLKGDALSVYARIAAICDVYDALTSKRAYKDGRAPIDAFSWMQNASGHFDPRFLKAFRGLIGTFPAGTLVRLQRGRLAVVLDEPPHDPLTPRVRTFFCATNRIPVLPEICDTATDPIVSVERGEQWSFADWDTMREGLMAAPPLAGLAQHQPPA